MIPVLMHPCLTFIQVPVTFGFAGPVEQADNVDTPAARAVAARRFRVLTMENGLFMR